MMRSVLLTLAGAVLAQAAQAQSVISAVQADPNGVGAFDNQASFVAGQLISSTFGGVTTKTLTDYGVNKVYAAGSASHQAEASSSWIDSFTVSGPAGSTVSVRFSFTIDGAANLNPGSNAQSNFKVFALRGAGWSLSGADDSCCANAFSPRGGGNNYGEIYARQVVAAGPGLPNGRVTETSLRDFAGFTNYANAGGQPGAFGSNVYYDEYDDAYVLKTNPGMPNSALHLFANGYRTYNGVSFSQLLSYASNPQLAAARAGLSGSYSLLDWADLCIDTCSTGVLDPTDLTLSFNVQAGSAFSLAAYLYAEGVDQEQIDFFNTAKVSGVTVSAGGSLKSQSGALMALPGGGYGYPAATPPAVPEPAAWAMMIGGFGLLGAAARRRVRPSVTYA